MSKRKCWAGHEVRSDTSTVDDATSEAADSARAAAERAMVAGMVEEKLERLRAGCAVGDGR